MKGGLREIFKNFQKKFKIAFLNSVRVPKNAKGWTLRCFLTSIVLQNMETNEGETLWWNPKKFKKSHSAKKNRVKTTKRVVLCFRGSGRRCFCFGRGSDVWSMFRTFVIQVDGVEQMNRKVDRLR